MCKLSAQKGIRNCSTTHKKNAWSVTFSGMSHLSGFSPICRSCPFFFWRPGWEIVHIFSAKRDQKPFHDPRKKHVERDFLRNVPFVRFSRICRTCPFFFWRPGWEIVQIFSAKRDQKLFHDPKKTHVERDFLRNVRNVPLVRFSRICRSCPFFSGRSGWEIVQTFECQKRSKTVP